ncbi:MAG: linear amide C-N hydrolase [Leucobacter sp.]
MCTTLGYTDLNGNHYHGRTLELDIEEVYAVIYVPEGTPFETRAGDNSPVTYEAKYPFIAVGAPDRVPTKEAPLTPTDVKVVEGMNSAGVTCSLLSYPTVAGVSEGTATTKKLIDATDVGSWVLANFASVDEVKEALQDESIFLTRIAFVGDLAFPFHFSIRDKSGKALVIEWHNGDLKVLDNPVGVMTNGPTFDWHLTNLGNYTHLSNIDVSSTKFGDLEVHQPDSGIATAGLPSSNTSSARFVKAAYYSKFAEKESDPDLALTTIGRVMNNFDRPRGATTDPGQKSGFPGKSINPEAPLTEYTSWTTLADLERGKWLVRTYASFNYTAFDLTVLSEKKELLIALLSKLSPLGGDATNALEPLPAHA